MSNLVNIGNVRIGGNSTVKIQSMLNTSPQDFQSSKEQLKDLTDAGCDIVRITVPNEESLKTFRKLKDISSVPLVADIHFDYRLAIGAIENGADKIRINPSNIGGYDKIKAVCDAARRHNVPIRIGVNAGSLEEEFKNIPKDIGMFESAVKNTRILEKCGFFDIVVSAKSSSVCDTVTANKLIAEKLEYPIHIGITEAGTKENAIIKSSIGIGSLILDGIGDTIRVSITGNPINEVIAAKKILNALGKYDNMVDIVSCPTCGRCDYDLESLVNKIEVLTKDIKKNVKIAVMGCVVNGIGEGKNADLGIVGGKNKYVIFKKGVELGTFEESEYETVFLAELNKIIN